LANFTWSWIYDGYAHHDAWFAEAAARLRAAESRATLCLALALGGGLEPFARRVDVPPVVRRPRRSAEAIRAELRLGARDPRPLVLVTFGGFGDALDLGEAAARNPSLRLLVVSARIDKALDNLRAIEPTDALPHHELVAAADCVLG